MLPVRAARASSLIVRAQADDKPAAKKKETKPYVGPKRGVVVRILRAESFWFKMTGKVVKTDQSGAKYPVVVRFETPNYYGITTNNYGLNEVEEVPADEYRGF